MLFISMSSVLTSCMPQKHLVAKGPYVSILYVELFLQQQVIMHTFKNAVCFTELSLDKHLCGSRAWYKSHSSSIHQNRKNSSSLVRKPSSSMDEEACCARESPYDFMALKNSPDIPLWIWGQCFLYDSALELLDMN